MDGIIITNQSPQCKFCGLSITRVTILKFGITIIICFTLLFLILEQNNLLLNLKLAFLLLNLVIHFELSDECIDFTMIITSRNNASISNFGGGFRWKSEYPWCIIEVKSKHFQTVFKKIEKNKKKNDGKTGIFTQNQFSSKSNFLFCYNSKTNRCKYLKFSLNTIEIFNFSNDKKKSEIVSHSFFYECLKFEFIRNMSKLRKFAILKIWYKILHKFFFKYLVDKIFLAQSKYLKILYKAHFFLLAFEVQILTKIRQNYEYLQIIFPRSTPPPNVQQNGTNLPAFFMLCVSLEEITHIYQFVFMKNAHNVVKVLDIPIISNSKLSSKVGGEWLMVLVWVMGSGRVNMSGSQVYVVYKDFEKVFVKNPGILNSVEWLKVVKKEKFRETRKKVLPTKYAILEFRCIACLVYKRHLTPLNSSNGILERFSMSLFIIFHILMRLITFNSINIASSRSDEKYKH
ncbi:hypothetical protein AGLY_005106 [Aphis glycines]|uniref:Uncharacterized protein n=1 Tax=Aphis glycines TaxID=307491 RepID=A0A6G0TW68_APHGL|nr:hypothetical protein AGLY_005106 [Aphis glycines]